MIDLINMTLKFNWPNWYQIKGTNLINIQINLIDLITMKLIFWAQQPPVGHDLLIHEVSRSHTTTHHSR